MFLEELKICPICSFDFNLNFLENDKISKCEHFMFSKMFNKIDSLYVSKNNYTLYISRNFNFSSIKDPENNEIFFKKNILNFDNLSIKELENKITVCSIFI
jgi:hypothetical protein